MTTESLVGWLEHLRTVDAEFKVPGAVDHRYQLNPALTEAQIAGFEQEYSIPLPSAYRDFLLKAGNGGSGPGLGLRPLAPWSVLPGSDQRVLLLAEGRGGDSYYLTPEGAVGVVSGEEFVRQAEGFDLWYEAWLDQSLIAAASHEAFMTLWYRPGRKPRPEVVEVLAIVEKLSERHPDWVGQYYLWGLLLMYNRQIDDAIGALERSVDVAPEELRASVMLGQLYYLLQQGEEVFRVVNRALERAEVKDDPFIQGKLYWLRAKAWIEQENVEAALADATRTRELDFFSFHNQIDYALFVIRAGRPELAEAALEEYIQKGRGERPESELRPEVYRLMAEMCTAWERPELAQHYQELAGRFSTSS